MASLTWWTWVWVNSGGWWWTGRPDVLRFMGSQRVGHDWATELNWTELIMSDAEHLFMSLLANCKSSLKKCLFSFSTHFLIRSFIFLVLSCMSCLHIFEINSLSVASFAIFYHSEDCLFTLLIVSFIGQKLLSLIRSYLFIFAFIFTTLGGGSKKILLWYMSEIVLLMLCSKSFKVSSFIFRSLMHFEFIFVYSVRECSNFILLQVAI